MTGKTYVAGGYTSTEAAEFLGCSYQWLANLRWRGRGPQWVRIRGRIYYPKGALERYKKTLRTSGP